MRASIVIIFLPLVLSVSNGSSFHDEKNTMGFLLKKLLHAVYRDDRDEHPHDHHVHEHHGYHDHAHHDHEYHDYEHLDDHDHLDHHDHFDDHDHFDHHDHEHHDYHGRDHDEHHHEDEHPDNTWNETNHTLDGDTEFPKPLKVVKGLPGRGDDSGPAKVTLALPENEDSEKNADYMYMPGYGMKPTSPFKGAKGMSAPAKIPLAPVSGYSQNPKLGYVHGYGKNSASTLAVEKDMLGGDNDVAPVKESLPPLHSHAGVFNMPLEVATGMERGNVHHH